MSHWTPEQWAIFFAAVIGVIGAIAGATVTIINALHAVAGKVDALEIKVDGRLTQLLDRTAVASRAEGVVVGRGEMAAVPVPAVTTTVDPAQVQEDGTMVIGVPANPTPPVLLVPVDQQKEGENDAPH